MPLSEAQIRALSKSTSVSAVAFQAAALTRELSRITAQDYSVQAREIKNVFACWPEFIETQLAEIQVASPDGADGTTAVRLRSLARALQQIYSCLQYLTASTAHQAPPAVQHAINHLVELHFPAANGRPVCIVQPTWEYNLSYLNLSAGLREMIAPATLDPNMVLGAAPDLIEALWTWRRDRLSDDEKKKLNADAPRHIAALSFAGLDTHDALLYPILAHELGHFIDFSHTPAPLHLSTTITQLTDIPFTAVQAILANKFPALLPQAVGYWNTAVTKVTTCVRELLADLLAVRMMGFGFFAAQTELLKTISPAWPTPATDPLVTGSGYPSTKFRFWSILRQLLENPFSGNMRTFLQTTPSPATLELGGILHYLDEWEGLTRFGAALSDKPAAVDPNAAPDPTTAIARLASNAVLNGYDAIVTVAQTAIPNPNAATLSQDFFERVERLKAEFPPTIRAEKKDAFAEILSAAWAYQLTYGEEAERAKPHDQQFAEYEKTCRLVMKSVELLPLQDEPVLALTTTNDAEDGAVLSKAHIATRLMHPISHQKRLEIIPLGSQLIGAASVDVRLGNWFVALRRTRLSGVQLQSQGSAEVTAKGGREESFVSRESRYLIHPGDLILGATLEFISLPSDVMAFVEGKSSWGRLGLIVATASQVAPGFHGVIVLELANAGTVPLELVPGAAIAQVVFQKMTQPVPAADVYRGSFYCQIKP